MRLPTRDRATYTSQWFEGGDSPLFYTDRQIASFPSKERTRNYATAVESSYNSNLSKVLIRNTTSVVQKQCGPMDANLAKRGDHEEIAAERRNSGPDLSTCASQLKTSSDIDGVRKRSDTFDSENEFAQKFKSAMLESISRMTIDLQTWNKPERSKRSPRYFKKRLETELQDLRQHVMSATELMSAQVSLSIVS